MTKYYKGNIIKANGFPESEFILNIARDESKYNYSPKYYVLDNSEEKAQDYFKNYSAGEFHTMLDELSDLTKIDANNDLKKKYDDLFINVFKMNANDIPGTNIIYEKIYDQDGNEYGKEIVTGQIFPINSMYSDYDISYEEGTFRIAFFDHKLGHVYYLYTSYRDICKYFLMDANGNKHKISESNYGELYMEMHPYTSHTIYFDDEYVTLTTLFPKYYIIKIKPEMIFPSSQRIEYVIANEAIANELEIQNYLKGFEHGLGKKKRKKEFIDLISNKCSSNYIGDNITFAHNGIKKEKLSEGYLTKEMQELEFMLSRLKSVSEIDYVKLNSEYQEMLNHEGGLSLRPLSIQSVIALQNKVELAYACHGGNAKRMHDYLEKQVMTYLDNYMNNDLINSKININDLDEIYEELLNDKDKNSYKEQNELLRSLSILYFFEIYENKEKISSKTLENSYIIDNLKRIITVISALKDEGIIKDMPSNLYEIANLDELLEFIQEIKFVSHEELSGENNKELIKKMQR